MEWEKVRRIKMGFCTHINLPSTLFGDYKWSPSSKESPLFDGLYIGVFDKGNDKVSFCEIEYKNGNWNWFFKSEEPCCPIGYVGIPKCDFYIGNNNEGMFLNSTSGLIVVRPWKNAKTERPTVTDLYIVVTKIDGDDRDGYVVSPSYYDASANMFDCELESPKEEVFAYIEMPRNWVDIY